MKTRVIVLMLFTILICSFGVWQIVSGISVYCGIFNFTLSLAGILINYRTLKRISRINNTDRIFTFFKRKHKHDFYLVQTIGAWWKNEDRYYRCDCGQGKIVYWGGHSELTDHSFGKKSKD